MILKRNLTLLLFAGILSGWSAEAMAKISVSSLRCEAREAPVTVETDRPMLSWKTLDDKTDGKQKAWHIMVASKKELLEPGKADLWDSGKQSGDTGFNVEYKGKPLPSNGQAFWTVQVWDENDVASGWAETAVWNMGIRTEDWKAKWISHEPIDLEKRDSIRDAHWIWASDTPVKTDEAITSRTFAYAPGEITRYFYKEFDLPADAKFDEGKLKVCTDNIGETYINGKFIAKTDNPKKVGYFPLKGVLKAGKNVIAISVFNEGKKPNIAALIAAVDVPGADGKLISLHTDAEWEASPAPHVAAFPDDVINKIKEKQDHVLKPVKVFGKWGDYPWHSVGFGEPPPPLPIYRKEVQIGKKIKRATAHICGLGQYVLSVNGQRIGDHFLDPAWSKYEKTVFYNSFDITSALKEGKNAFGVMLGKGYYNTDGDRRIHGYIGTNPLMLAMQSVVEYEDGSTETIITDNTWKWVRGPVVHNSILGGDDYDASRLPDGWNQPGFDDKSWAGGIEVNSPMGKLHPAPAPPMRMFDVFKPKRVLEPDPGVFVYDFGQNASAIPRIKVKGKAGQTITFVYAEQLKDGEPAQNNGSGRVTQAGIGHGLITYTLKGGEEETWNPEFFYTGYQYMEVTGAVPAGKPNPAGLPEILDFESVHVRSDQPVVGKFTTSNPIYNRTDQLIDWSVKSNLTHVLSDCPTREKLGWLEQTYLMWPSLAYKYDMQSVGNKVTWDIRDSQLEDGFIPTVAPSYPNFVDGFHYTAEWGAAGVLVPWELYRWYNDKRALETNYNTMKGFTDYVEKTSNDLIAKPGLGDWFDYGHGQPLGASRFTPTDLTATAIFKQCADTVSSAALALGKTDDAKKYQDLSARITKKFNETYYNGKGEYKNLGSPQTANAMAYVCGLVPPGEEKKVVDIIVEDIKKREYQQTSGDIGYTYLLRALAKGDRNDVIFRMLARTDLGSYAYIVNAHWTSMPESWNASKTASLNHFMLGHIQEWFMHNLVGIRLAADTNAFKTFSIQPTVGEGVTSASGSLNSPYGMIVSEWKKDDSTFELNTVVPFGTTADIYLPATDERQILVNGHPLSDEKDVKILRKEKSAIVLQAGSGARTFKVATGGK